MSNARNNVSKLRSIVDVTEPRFGAKGDGTTDDLAAMQAVLSSGASKVTIPAGTYRLPFTATAGLSVSAAIALEGQGAENTELVFVPSSNSYRNLFAILAQLKLSRLKISVVCPAGGSFAIFNGDLDGLTITDCYLDGGVVETAGAASHTAYGISLGTIYDAHDLTASGCTFTRFSYPLLKTVASTVANRRLTFKGCTFTGNFFEDLSFNSPAGVMDDVLVSECRFKDHAGTSISAATQIYCGFASVTNFRLVNCHATGELLEAFHVEENSVNGVISGNTIEVDGVGIFVVENDVAGSYFTPRNIAIIGNSIKKQGTQKAAGSYGIWLANNASPEVPLQSAMIAGNVIEGFEIGVISGATTDDACRIRDNIAYNCAEGYRFNGGAAIVEGNTSRVCDIGIKCDTATMVLRHRFIECTTACDAVGRAAMLVDPSFEWAEFAAVALTTTNKNIFTIGTNDRVYGELSISTLAEAVTGDAGRRDTVSWDGTTFSRTNRLTYAPGSVTVDSVNNAGALAVQHYTAADRTSIRLSAVLTGTVIVAI